MFVFKSYLEDSQHSVLLSTEPDRTLLLSERVNGGESEPAVIKAKDEFRFIATMNPGGDYGKKEVEMSISFVIKV